MKVALVRRGQTVEVHKIKEVDESSMHMLDTFREYLDLSSAQAVEDLLDRSVVKLPRFGGRFGTNVHAATA